MNSHKHIIWVAPEFYPVYTGHGIYLQKLAPFLEQAGYKFTVVTTKQSIDAKDTETIGNIDVVRIDCLKNGKIDFLSYSLKAAKYLYNNRASYRVIHLHGFFDRFGVFGLFSKVFNKKLIMQMVLVGVDDPQSCISSFKFQTIRKRFFSFLDTIITISSPLTKACENFGLPKHKIVQIPQGVDESVFKPSLENTQKSLVKNELDIPSTHRIAIFVGAIIERKGIRELLESWKEVSNKHPETSLVLLGPFSFGGDNFNYFADEMQKLANEIGNVTFAGSVNNVEKYLQASDLFVFPSKKEGFGNVIIEAMACKLPCIVTEMDGVGYDTVIDGKTGFIVKNQQELTDKLDYLLSNNELMTQYGEAGMQRTLQHFKLGSVAKLYDEVYHQDK